MTDEAPRNTLEEQAFKRKEKLKSLKRKINEKSGDGENKNDSRILPAPKFRSYKPQDKNLEENRVKNPEDVNVTTQVKDLLELAKSEMVIEQLDIATLAPRRPDWDLKRDVAKKLEKLERRTQKAMAELIREKLKEKQDLADIVNAPVT